ncbi:tetratricopeptide repeat protein [candidate division WOR-3 bacterium]|nr:tetratricopeptide repeat protein [candidate division WOR-3 bacterium]
MAGPTATGLSPDRVRSTVELVEAQLEQARRYYPKELPPRHRARLGEKRDASPFPGNPPANAGGTRLDAPTDFGGTQPGVGNREVSQFFPTDDDPLARHLELCRCHAEALLVHFRLGEVILDIEARERLTIRALGILPDSEADRFGELAGCPGFHGEKTGRSATGLLAAVESIERHFGQSTALAYGMLVLAGMHSPVQLAENAARLDRLFDRVVSAPPVIQALDLAAEDRGVPVKDPGPWNPRTLESSTPSGSSFQRLFAVLLAVRDRVWELKPNRASTPFLLPQVLECYLGNQSSAGNSLGLAVLDAIIVSRLGPAVSFHVENDVLFLEVLIDHKSVYWDTTRPTPLSFVPVNGAQPVTPAGLFAMAWGSLATAHFNSGRFDRAVRLYERVLELVPDSAATLNSIAACRLRQRLPDQALAAVERALECRPDSPEAHYTRGNAWAMMEQWPRAIAAFKNAIALRPDYVEVYNNLGFAFQRTGAHEQAVAAFEAAVEIRPDYAQAHFNLGNIHLELERYDAAVRCYREAARLQPAMAQAWYNMGQALYRKGDVDPAITAYKRAVEVNPKHFGAWHNLGIAYRDKGMKDKAVEALERAVAINPSLMR